MPILMRMHWEGIKSGQYDKLNSESNYESDTPKGAIFHTAAFDKGGMHVVDIWETAEDFNSFIENRLKPIVNKLGIKEQPQVEITKIHRAFFPGYNAIISRQKQKA